MTTFLNDNKRLFGNLALISAMTALIGCGQEENNNTQSDTCSGTDCAVVATRAADFSSGAHSVIEAQGARNAFNNFQPTDSDIAVAANGRYFFRMERSNLDSIAKFDIDAPETPIWQYSTRGDESSSNPYDLVFASAEKAYLLRYDSPKIWIVNPQADSEQSFKSGEIDLSELADSDGIPEIAYGVIAQGKLFVVLQHMDRDNGWTPLAASVAVIDTNTDQPIDVDTNDGVALSVIALPVKNPGSIGYLSTNDTIYIQGTGKYASSFSNTPAEYSGGIATLDPNTYATSLLIDDGDDTSHPYGNINEAVVVSATKGYFVAYLDWGNNAVYSFDPTTGVVADTAIIENKNIADLAVDRFGKVWVANASDHTIDIVDPATDSIEQSVYTELDPIQTAFTQK